MKNFKVGDKVIRIASNFGIVKTGEIYTVSEILTYGIGMFIKEGIRIEGDLLYEYDPENFEKVKFFVPKNLKVI